MHVINTFTLHNLACVSKNYYYHKQHNLVFFPNRLNLGQLVSRAEKNNGRDVKSDVMFEFPLME